MDTLIFFIGIGVIGLIALFYVLFFDKPKHHKHEH